MFLINKLILDKCNVEHHNQDNQNNQQKIQNNQQKIQNNQNNQCNQSNQCNQCKLSLDQLAGESLLHKFSNISFLNKFSSEGLCYNCEVLKFPNRFRGCMFCKRPIRGKNSCTICADGFEEWLKSEINLIGMTGYIIKKIARNLLNERKLDIHDINDANDKQFIIRNDDNFYNWPGFYVGNYSECFYVGNYSECSDNFYPIWIIPKLHKKLDCLDIEKLNYLDLINISKYKLILLDLLKINNINLYDNTQIKLENISTDQIIKINSFNTKII